MKYNMYFLWTNTIFIQGIFLSGWY